MENGGMLEFVDDKTLNKPKRLFSVKRNESAKAKKVLEKFYTKLTTIIVRLKPHAGEFAPKASRILNSIVYKYGHAYKRHMFLRHARHSYSLAKKLSEDRIFSLVKLLASGLQNSSYEHNLTSQGIDHLCATILHRIVMLDKLRIICGRNIEFSIGYVELKHNINLNLLFIALASELGSVALTQLRVLTKTYNDLCAFFKNYAQKSVPTLSELPVKSVIFNEQNEIVDRIIDDKHCDLDGLISFIKNTENVVENEDLLRLEEIRQILSNRSANITSKDDVPDNNFYRDIPKKKKRKNT